MATIDSEFLKFFNLLKGSPSFVIRIDAKSQKGAVSNPALVPDNDGDYLVHGTTILASGTRVESIFSVDTDAGGTLTAVYWQTKTGWMDSQDELISTGLGVERDEIFPYDWAFSVPLENDIFHPNKGQ